MTAGILGTCLLALLAGPLAAQDATALFDIVRGGDLRALKAALRNPGAAKAKDGKGVTLLMYAAAFAGPDAVKMILDAGADVNAKSAFDATALLWGAGDPAKAKMLIE